MKLAKTALALLEDTRWYLDALTNDQYGQALPVLSHSSIGQHTRHFIEFFECLLLSEGENLAVCYDERKRDLTLESDLELTRTRLDQLREILENINADCPLCLTSTYPESGTITVDSTLKRELMYNIEHTIHHLAIIKNRFKMSGSRTIHS